jgi:hypothetical protein
MAGALPTAVGEQVPRDELARRAGVRIQEDQQVPNRLVHANIARKTAPTSARTFRHFQAVSHPGQLSHEHLGDTVCRLVVHDNDLELFRVDGILPIESGEGEQ